MPPAVPTKSKLDVISISVERFRHTEKDGENIHRHCVQIRRCVKFEEVFKAVIIEDTCDKMVSLLKDV
jgi:hypothetical protein